MTDEQIEQVLTDLHEGKSLQRILKEHGFRPRDFFVAIESTAQRSESYELAQMRRAELYAEECVDIADTEFDAAVAAVRIKARQWYASKLKPHKFGERIDVNVHATVDIRAAIADGRRRVLDATKLQLECVDDGAELLK